MDEKKQRDFEAEIFEVCLRYDISNASICGTCSDDKFIGILHIGKRLSGKPGGAFESVLNLGRLWQHARTVTKNYLDQFDKKWN